MKSPKAARLEQIKQAIEVIGNTLSLPQCSQASLSVLTCIAQEVANDFADAGWTVSVKKLTQEDDPTVIDVIVRHPEYSDDEKTLEQADKLLKALTPS